MVKEFVGLFRGLGSWLRNLWVYLGFGCIAFAVFVWMLRVWELV